MDLRDPVQREAVERRARPLARRELEGEQVAEVEQQRAAGAREDALSSARELLALNPRDNQAVRTLTMTWLLEGGRDEDAAAVAKGYPEDMFPETRYGGALALFRLQRREEADAALREAISDLPLVTAELLKARHRVPRSEEPGFVTIGGADQAYVYWLTDGVLWTRTSGAMDWLRQMRGAVRESHQA